MGQGIPIKAALRGNFSLLVFARAQVLVDAQPLVVLMTGSGRLDGFTHASVVYSVVSYGSSGTWKEER